VKKICQCEDCIQPNWLVSLDPLHPVAGTKENPVSYMNYTLHSCISITYHKQTVSFVMLQKTEHGVVSRDLSRHYKVLCFKLALFSASSNSVSASSKLPMCMQQTAFPFKINPVIGYFSEKSWKMRYASCIFEPPWFI